MFVKFGKASEPEEIIFDKVSEKKSGLFTQSGKICQGKNAQAAK